jgi:hypothetical protein
MTSPCFLAYDGSPLLAGEQSLSLPFFLTFFVDSLGQLVVGFPRVGRYKKIIER